MERILRHLARVGEVVVDEARPTPHGTALLTPSLPLVWQLNALRAEDPAADAAMLAGEAELLLGDLGHRKVVVQDERRGRQLTRGFERLGWNAFRLLIMVRRRSPEPARHPAEGGEVSHAVGRAAIDSFRREQPFGWQEEAVRQLAAMDERLARATGTGRDFASPPDDPACACRLYTDHTLAQIEEVGTVEARRGRGHARAAVLAAANAAEAGGCDLVFLTTDAADWPQQLYTRLGFDAVASYYEFLKLPLGRGNGPRP